MGSATENYQQARDSEVQRLVDNTGDAIDAEKDGKAAAVQTAQEKLAKLFTATASDLKNYCDEVVLVGKVRGLLHQLNTKVKKEFNELHDECKACSEAGECHTEDIYPGGVPK